MMHCNPVLAIIAVVIGLIALVMFGFAVFGYYGKGPWNGLQPDAMCCGGVRESVRESPSDSYSAPNESQKRVFDEIKPMYDGLELLSLRLHQVDDVGNIENYIPTGETVSYLNEVRQHAQNNGYMLPRTVSEGMQKLECTLKDSSANCLGQKSGTNEVYKIRIVISDLICAIEKMLDSLRDTADVLGVDGRGMISRSQRLNLLKDGKAGFMSNLSGTTMSAPVKKALGDVVDFQPELEQEQKKAQYSDNLYRFAKKPEDLERHKQAIEDRKGVSACTNTVGRKRIIEEEIMKSGWSGRLPKIRTCVNGSGPYTTQDAPNVALGLANRKASGPYNSGLCGTNGSCC